MMSPVEGDVPNNTPTSRSHEFWCGIRVTNLTPTDLNMSIYERLDDGDQHCRANNTRLADGTVYRLVLVVTMVNQLHET